MSRHNSRPSGRTSPEAGRGGSAGMPMQTKVLVGALVLAVGAFGVYYGLKMFGGSGSAVAAVTPREASDLETLRALSLDELRRERKRRTDAFDALARKAGAPPEEITAAREAAHRATVALHEKVPPPDR